jgi:hypothetical protein
VWLKPHRMLIVGDAGLGGYDYAGTSNFLLFAAAFAAALIRSRWTTANRPAAVAQFFPGLALQNGHNRESGLTGRISGIIILFATP